MFFLLPFEEATDPGRLLDCVLFASKPGMGPDLDRPAEWDRRGVLSSSLTSRTPALLDLVRGLLLTFSVELKGLLYCERDPGV